LIRKTAKKNSDNVQIPDVKIEKKVVMMY